MIVGALCARKPRLAGATALAFIWLNRRFYLLLVRKCGWRQAAAGIPLHVLHHLIAIMAVPVGVAVYLRDRVSGTKSS